MVIQQKFNKKIKAWVKFKITKKGTVILNVKQKNPTKKFAGVMVRRF